MFFANFSLFPERASTMAGEVDALYGFGVAVSAVCSVLITLVVVYFAIRYRRRSPDEVGTPQPSPLWLELTWSIVPLIIMLIMFAWGAKVYFDGYRVPEDAERYYAVGKRWMWKFQHPEGNREINDFHIPVGRKIELILTSEDVIHSFFVPAFRVKRDAVPGRYSSLWFEATKTGTYHIFCAEYCGAEHSLMTGKLIVMEPHEYEEWLEGNPPQQSPIASGAALFEAKACHTCHRSDSGARAPMLALLEPEVELLNGRMAETDDQYLRESIIDPGAKVVAGYQPIMPTYRGQLSEEEILELIRYIRSLRSADGNLGEEQSHDR